MNWCSFTSHRDRRSGRCVRPGRRVKGAGAMTARDRVSRRVRQFEVLGLSSLGVFLGSTFLMLLLCAVLPTESAPPQENSGPVIIWPICVLLGGVAIAIVLFFIGGIRVSLVSS